MRRPQRRWPSSSRTRTFPSRSCATVLVSRSKKDASRTDPSGVESGCAFAKPLFSRVTASLVDVQGFVRRLIHRLPVQARPPRGDPDAELDRHRQLRGAVEVLEGFADTDADLARVALVRVRHANTELIAAEPAARVGGTHGSLQLRRQHANPFIAHVVAVRVVDLLQVVE